MATLGKLGKMDLLADPHQIRQNTTHPAPLAGNTAKSQANTAKGRQFPPTLVGASYLAGGVETRLFPQSFLKAHRVNG